MKRRKVRFSIEGQSFERWYGATVEHAVIAFNQSILKEIRDGKAWVVDARGSRVGLGGTLENGVELYIRRKTE